MSVIKKKKFIHIALFILPAASFYILFVLHPGIRAIFVSFTNWRGMMRAEDIKWIGLQNYQRLFDLSGPVASEFWHAMLNNIIILIVGGAFILTLGMFLAVLLTAPLLKFKRSFRTVIFLPNVISIVAVALVWTYFYQYDGLLNSSFVRITTTMGWVRPQEPCLSVQEILVRKKIHSSKDGDETLYTLGIRLENLGQQKIRAQELLGALSSEDVEVKYDSISFFELISSESSEEARQQYQSSGNYVIALPKNRLYIEHRLAINIQVKEKMAGNKTAAFSWLVPFKIKIDPAEESFSKTFSRFMKTDSYFKIKWLKDFPLAAIILCMLWTYVGLYTVLFMAGIESIPESYNEAARLDGVNAFQRFRYITLPLLRDVIVVAATLWMIAAIKAFGLIYAMFRGEPPKGAQTVATYFFIKAFGSAETSGQNDFSLGTTMAVIMLLVIIILSFIIRKIFRRKEAIEF